ncbi:MAG: efflux RND transporter periplasmic adaptor subunit [Ktedonobacteraceae bacterium]|nr:efflux RND transporter periplasmic adaptor subunit [Ktedonobacteraceae bacterium]
MHNYQRRGQFRPPFSTEVLPEGENAPHTETLYARKNDAPTIFSPRVTVQPLSPNQIQAQTKPVTLLQPEQWSMPLVPVTPLPGSNSALHLVPKKKIILVATILFLLFTVAFFAWMSVRVTTPDVTLYQVSEHAVTQYSGGGGIVFPRQQFTLSYPVVEYAVDVLVKVGDQVSPNQPLLKLDPTRLNAQIKQLSDDAAAAQAYLSSVSTTGNAASIAQAQQQYTLAKNKYNALMAESSSLLLHDGSLISPMSGVITSVNVNSGEIFAADAPLLVIMDEAVVIVHVKVPLANLSQVHTGQKAVVTPSALPNLNFQGTISAVIPQADPQTDTFEVWVSIPNPYKTLLPGMSAFVRIQTPKQALVVPRLAVLNPSLEPVTFIVRHQFAYLQPVQIDALIGDQFLIHSGLKVGDQIVLVGQNMLRNNQHVHVRSVEM